MNLANNSGSNLCQYAGLTLAAAMAVHAFNGTAILLRVIHFSLSTALIHNSTPASSIFFFATIPIIPCCFPHLSILDTLDRHLRFSFRSQSLWVVLPLIVSSEDVLHVVVHFPNGVRNIPRPSRMRRSVDPANFSLYAFPIA